MTDAFSLLDECVLTELFGRAMRQAGEALFEMSNRTVSISTPELRRYAPDEVMDLAGGAGALIVAVHVGISGGIDGHALLLLPVGGARRLAHRLLEGVVDDLPDDPDNLEFDALERSALAELGNVTIAAVLNELGTHLGSAIHPTVPQAATEFAGAILDGVLLELLLEADDVLAARTVFVEGASTIDGTMLVLPRAASLRDLIDAVGVAS